MTSSGQTIHYSYRNLQPPCRLLDPSESLATQYMTAQRNLVAIQSHHSTDVYNTRSGAVALQFRRWSDNRLAQETLDYISWQYSQGRNFLACASYTLQWTLDLSALNLGYQPVGRLEVEFDPQRLSGRPTRPDSVPAQQEQQQQQQDDQSPGEVGHTGGNIGDVDENVNHPNVDSSNVDNAEVINANFNNANVQEGADAAAVGASGSGHSDDADNGSGRVTEAEDPEEESCPICYENLKPDEDSVCCPRERCTGKYHGRCIGRWMDTGMANRLKCPLW